MFRSILGAFAICAALVVPGGAAAADDEQQTATCPASASLPFTIPTANGGTVDATLSATLSASNSTCSGTFDVVVDSATVGSGTIRLTQEANELRARVEGTLTADPFSGTFHGQIELNGSHGEIQATFCDTSGTCQEVEATVHVTDTGFVITARSESDEEEDD